jgi:uncharacterized protein (DUF2235 family)
VKNIVLCSDGTANEFARDRTNVVKLFYALDHNSPQQFAYYHPGLGTWNRQVRSLRLRWTLNLLPLATYCCAMASAKRNDRRADSLFCAVLQR